MAAGEKGCCTGGLNVQYAMQNRMYAVYVGQMKADA